jgi:hypothetical protein
MIRGILVVLMISVCGCWSARYDEVRRWADEQNQVLAPYCQIPRPNAWCDQQTAMVKDEESRRFAKLDAERARAAAVAAAVATGMQSFGNSMSQRPQVNCQTYRVGNITNTYCH